MYSSDYRKIAKESCKKYSNILALIYLIIFVLLNIGGCIYFKIHKFNYEIKIDLSILFSIFLGGQFLASKTYIARKVYLQEEIVVKDAFYGFKEYKRNLLINLLETIYTALWFLLLIIPGIIKMISYSMAFHVSEEYKDYTPNQCIKRSKELMEGHKWQYFCLILSYIWWILLSVLTLGILLLWVEPKIEQAKYEFYMRVSGQIE